MSMADFKKSGGTLGGREQKNDFFEGEPRSMHGHNPLSNNASKANGTTGSHGHSGTHAAGAGAAGAGVVGGLAAGKAAHDHHSGRRGSSSSSSSSDDEHHKTKKAGLAGGLAKGHSKHDSATAGTTGTGVHNTAGTGVSGADHAATAKKPSLIDRLNPMKDADGDGQKGIMN
ncbi:hypothetical protein KVT40_007058 [Elsinoe batatas]|uniref:Uncharacterized protein n=1 Tax=Elsinoe batatas TaxID=2601811 RepID=A0A8K0PE80_9PEZI|nr:hypothetical protein KVT40_007058 [Elsinoe batatas]